MSHKDKHTDKHHKKHKHGSKKTDHHHHKGHHRGHHHGHGKDDGWREDLNRFFDKHLYEHALSVAIIQNGDCVWDYNKGTIVEGQDIAPTRDTIYRIGSVSKAFVVAVLFIAVVNKKISVDTPVSEQVPAFAPRNPFGSKPMTWFQLAANMGGICRLSVDPKLHPDSKIAVEETNKQFLLYNNGSQPSYSNVGFALLGNLVAENVLGGSFFPLLQSHFLDPIGMSRTGVSFTDEVKAQMATGYGPNGPYPKGVPDIEWYSPSGGMYASTNDNLAFMSELMGNKRKSGEASFFAEKGLRDLLFKSYYSDPDGLTSQGTPWETINLGQTVCHRKYGCIHGFSALIALIPEHNIGISLMWNTEHLDTRAILQKAFRIILPAFGILAPVVHPLRWKELVPALPTNPSDYIGKYGGWHPMFGDNFITLVFATIKKQRLIRIVWPLDNSNDEGKRYLSVSAPFPDDKSILQVWYPAKQTTAALVRDEQSFNREYFFFKFNEKGTAISLTIPGIIPGVEFMRVTEPLFNKSG